MQLAVEREMTESTALGEWLGFVEETGLNVLYSVEKVEELVREAVLDQMDGMQRVDITEAAKELGLTLKAWEEYRGTRMMVD